VNNVPEQRRPGQKQWNTGDTDYSLLWLTCLDFRQLWSMTICIAFNVNALWLILVLNDPHWTFRIDYLALNIPYNEHSAFRNLEALEKHRRRRGTHDIKETRRDTIQLAYTCTMMIYTRFYLTVDKLRLGPGHDVKLHPRSWARR
jgi:hypothetical protein